MRIVNFTIVVNYREDEAIVARIDALAEKRGTDRSALIREAIRRFLEAEEKEVPGKMPQE